MKKRSFRNQFTELALIPVAIYKRLLKTIDKIEAEDIESLNSEELPNSSEQASDSGGANEKETGTDDLIAVENASTQVLPPESMGAETQTEVKSFTDAATEKMPLTVATVESQTPATATVDTGVDATNLASPEAEPGEVMDEPLSDDDVNMKIRIFPCKSCGAAFTTKYSLGRHIATQHAGKRSDQMAGKKRGRKPTRKGSADIHDPIDEEPQVKQGPVTRSTVTAGKKRSAKPQVKHVNSLRDFTDTAAINPKGKKIVKESNQFRRWL